MNLSPVTAVVGAADARLDALRRQLTPGQRWTSALGLGVALTLLLFGLPAHVRSVGGAGQAAAAPPGAAAPAAAAPTAGTPPGVAPGAAPSFAAGTGVGSAPTSTGATGDQPSTGATTFEPVPGGSRPTAIVALVRSGDGPPGRDDEAMARAASDAASVPVTVVPFDPADAEACGRVAAEAGVVLAATDLGPVRDCLVGSGVVVVARDGAGSVAPAGGGGQVLSTRPSPLEALFAITEPAARPLVRGKVGIVADAVAQPAVEPAVADLKAAGIDVAATAYLPADPAGLGAIPGAVRDFASEGVQTVVFAVPVAQQQAWVAQETVLLPGARHLVVDAADAISNEAYPPTFEGAAAVTTMRSPWYERTHEATPEQTACADRWAQAAPPGALTNTELAHVLAWCDLVAVVEAAPVSPSAATLGEELRSLTVASALTSELGPLPGGGWGPRQVAVLAWKAACACWEEAAPFADRTAPR